MISKRHVLAWIILAMVVFRTTRLRAQDAPAEPAAANEAAAPVEAATGAPTATLADDPLQFSLEKMSSLWDLAVQGGWFMIPIALASIVTIAFTFERMIGLRSNRIAPRALIRKLRELTDTNGVDPRSIWNVCKEHPSPLANSVQAAVLKIGRPMTEVEKAVEDAVARETNGMTRNLRPINVVAGIAPLLGLLGTVQGMIMAFMVTSTTTSTGNAKAQELAHGIYTALVTTFAGLCVAIVSVVLANWLEGKIERLLARMERVFLNLLPHLERYEGKVRVAQTADQAAGFNLRVKTLRPKPDVDDARKKSTGKAESKHADQRREKIAGAPRVKDAMTSDLRKPS